MSTNAVIARLQAERDEAVAFIEHTMEAVEAEQRDISETEQRSLDTQRERISALDAQIKPLAEFQQQRNSAVKVDARISSTTTTPRTPEPVDSLGAVFTDSDQYRNYSGGRSGRVTFDARPSEIRAVLTTTTDPGAKWLPSAPQFVQPAPAFSTPLLDAIQRIPVSGNSVDVVSYGAAATGADVVAEGAPKPEATITSAVTPTSLETIAAWVQTSRQLLQDAPSARNIIDNQLTRGILRKLESEVAGVIAGSSIGTTAAASAGGNLGTVRAAIGALQAAGFSPDVVMANPVDLAGMDIDVFANTLGGPTNQGSYWGLRPVPVAGLAAGTVYVADANSAFALFERTGVDVYMTDSDILDAATPTSAFRANVMTILAETRAKGAVVNATAATKVAIV